MKVTKPTSPSLARQQWLDKATVALVDLFHRKGFDVPNSGRVSVGWPKGSHGKQRAISQCWPASASSDGHNEIFISPEITDTTNTLRVLGTLAHELVHATVGNDEGHGPAFKRCATAIGLTGKMTSTTEADEFIAFAIKLVKHIGAFPAGSLAAAGVGRKQTTRLLKCECSDCGYTVRVTRKWVDVALPICPIDEQPITCDSGEG